jgi:flavin-binding protein dodecin
MKAVALAIALLALAACEDASTRPNLGTVEQQCGAANRPFEESWPCVRVGFAGVQDGYPGVRDQYLATGDVVAENVRAGQQEDPMADSVYKVVEVVGTSTESWERAARTAVERASKSLRDLRVAEVVEQDVVIEKGKVTSYRTKLKLSFKYEGGDA